MKDEFDIKEVTGWEVALLGVTKAFQAGGPRGWGLFFVH